jgi:hypothetical protein
MKRSSLLRLISVIVLLLLVHARGRAESVSFDGVDDRVSIDIDGALATTNFTVEAGFKRASGGTATSLSGYQVFPLVARGYAENFCLGVRTNGAIFGGFTDGFSTFSVVSTATAPIGEWHHAAVTYDGAALKVYLDGQLADQTIVATTAKVSVTGTLLGRMLYQGIYYGAFAGQMDEDRRCAFILTASSKEQPRSSAGPASRPRTALRLPQS